MTKNDFKLLENFLKKVSNKLVKDEKNCYIDFEDIRGSVSRNYLKNFNNQFATWYVWVYGEDENREYFQGSLEKDGNLEFPLVSDLMDFFIYLIDGDLCKIIKKP